MLQKCDLILEIDREHIEFGLGIVVKGGEWATLETLDICQIDGRTGCNKTVIVVISCDELQARHNGMADSTCFEFTDQAA